MADLQRGATFSTGIPDAASLHQLVDAGTILPEFITGKTTGTPTSSDSFVFVKNSALVKCTLAGLIAAFPQGGAANVFALRKLGITAGTAAAGNDPRFPSRLTGIRKANNTAPDTAATPRDMTPDTKSLVGLTQFNWDDANVFTDSLTGNKTYTHINAFNGRTIQIIIKLNGFTPTMPAGVTVANIGSGTTFKHYFLTRTTAINGVTGFCLSI